MSYRDDRAARLPNEVAAIEAVLDIAALLLTVEGCVTPEDRLEIVRCCTIARDAVDAIRPSERRRWAEQVTANAERTTIAREILALSQHRDPRIVGVGLQQIADRIAP